VKVLSNSTLRGNITERIDDKRFKINENWGLTKDILSGFRFKLLKHKHRKIYVRCYDLQSRILCLSDPLPEEYSGHHSGFEITSGEEAPVLAARIITGTQLKSNFPELDMKLGSTKGTNALLEKKGAKTVLFVTKGFKDILHIGNQQRPDIFALNVIKPKPFPDIIAEIDERIDSSGKILRPLMQESFCDLMADLRQKGYTCAAVSFMNSYRNPVHERELKDYLLENGFTDVSISTDLSSQIKYLQRTETTSVNAYLSPVIHSYIENIRSEIRKCNLHVMTSAGGLARSDVFNPRDSLLSGPAGGVVGASAKSIQSGINKLITFDMGGTSTDVSRYDSKYEYTFDLKVGDAEIFAPAISIETVAAGGGSVCSFDGFRLCVGPESAGAHPGPACYGAGGPLTITDINLLAGRIDIQQFGIPVFREEAEKKLEELIRSIENKTGERREKEAILRGFLKIANEIMAGAIKKISVSRGYDPAEYALVAFGGAGAMHACDIAELLKIETILVPGDAGILSAYGIGNARIERFAEKQVLLAFKEYEASLPAWFEDLRQSAIKMVAHENIPEENIEITQQTIYLRLKGQDSGIDIEWDEDSGYVIKNFRKRYEQIYGYWAEDRDVEIESIRAIASVKSSGSYLAPSPSKRYKPSISHKINSLTSLKWQEVPVINGSDLKPGANVTGPAIILHKHSTTFVSQGWEMILESNGNSVLKTTGKDIPGKNNNNVTIESELELFTNRFMSVAGNMGAMLQRTSMSVNVKERLDFSCALLDANGYLVANAPHIPVHLGSLGICVRSLIRNVSIGKGDVIITNHPAYGGSHLPDITLVSPVHMDTGKLVGFVVSRAHHAEIGGIVPASMPPDATSLAEEGVIIEPFHLVKNNKVEWKRMKEILTEAIYPSRAVDENIADLHAALAANRNGKAALLKLIEDFGEEEVLQYMKLLKEYAAEKMRYTLRKIADGIYEAEEHLDDDSILKVKIIKENDTCTIDFTGSGDIHPGNMNATYAIVNSVVIYFLRLLINEPIPLNDGMFEPVKLIVPKGLLNPVFPEDPARCPAISGGNTEVSQRLTDTLLKAFKLMSCSQGTMNNVMFGNSSYSYYETLCGGCGAGPGFNGASAVHHHMTNTRITDPEIIEHRYPVRLERFEIRASSGGKGKFTGGDGIVREMTFLETARLSILSQHRKEVPYGLGNGKPGEKGSQYVIKSDGTVVKLKGIDGITIDQGDRLIIKTPGGGGYGKPAF